MRSQSSTNSRVVRASPSLAIACLSACISWSTVVHAEPSELPPEVGYNYDEIETGRIASKNGANRALGSSVSALFDPAHV